ncbi:MAG TPA: hypothetical protein VGI40_08310 [Pirellulaceae bacterium]|jgi:hypothetical protein
MRRDDHLFKTMSAARLCIAECLKASSPHDSLEKYLVFLLSDPQWSQAEVGEVEAVVRRAIQAAGSQPAGASNCGWPLSSQSAPSVMRS